MSQYNADAIEVLTGLEPVRKRPGMYTDTTRPNHLAQEVIDNSVDEALGGHADKIDVTLHGVTKPTYRGGEWRWCRKRCYGSADENNAVSTPNYDAVHI